MPELNVEAIGALSERELASLVEELVEAEGKTVAPRAEGGLIYTTAESTTLIEVRRSGITPLAGVSLGAIARQAAELGAARAEIYLTGAIDAERQAALGRVLDEVQRGTGVRVGLTDAQALLERLQVHPDLARKYFPSEQEAEEAGAQQQIPASLVKFANAVASKPARARPARQYLRLAWTAAAVGVLVWLPIRITPFCARWIAGVGLGLIALAVTLAQLFDPDRGERSYGAKSVMDAVIPVKDELAVRREITTAEGTGPVRLLLDTLKRLPGAAVRAGTQTALLLFLLTSCFGYMLVLGGVGGQMQFTYACLP